MHADVACQQLGHDIPQQLDPELTQKIQAKRSQDWAATIDYCLDQDVKVIYIELNQKNLLYTRATRSLNRMFFEPRRAESAQEATAHVDNLFFQQDLEAWQQQGLVEVWDRREFLALCRRPFDNCYQGWTFDRSRPHLWLDSESLWYNGQHAMTKIMEFCHLPTDASRWQPWLEVYHEWQQLQSNILEFTFNLQHIVEAIVKDWYYEIPYLTFEQEVVIQHCLIYQHGLNLKTWGLEKFPSNTQQLHQLLEPNTHKIESIY